MHKHMEEMTGLKQSVKLMPLHKYLLKATKKQQHSNLSYTDL